MQGEHYGNAMTEIALALAMAFFSLMILTMVSMGAGQAVSEKKIEDIQDKMVGLMLAPPPDDTPTEVTERVRREDRLIVFYEGQYLDQNLKVVDPKILIQGIGTPGAGRLILALSPDASITDAMAARTGIPVGDLTLTTLDQSWLDRLAAGGQ